MTHNAEKDAAHAPIRVSHFAEFEGWVFIACACGENPISGVWLRHHWTGDPEAGKAAVYALIAAQVEAEASVVLPPAESGGTDA